MPPRLVETRTHIVAVEDGRVTGTIGVLSQPGRVGLIFPPELDRPSGEVLESLIDAALGRLERAGAAFAQLTLALEDAAQAEPFLRHGFSLLTDALVLERPPLAPPEAIGDSQLTSIPCDPRDDSARLAALLERINESTLDCPELDALRTPHDLLAAHQSHATEGRARWWRYEDAGNDVGVVLGTTAEDSSGLEILFFGVVPEQRGKGFGRKLLNRFLREADADRVTVRAGMDGRNHFAESIYAGCGFLKTASLRVWVHPLAAPV